MIEDAIMDVLSVSGMTYREAMVRAIGDRYDVPYNDVMCIIDRLIDEGRVKVSTDSMNHQYIEVA
ncbi:MAG: BlaI/MecI/CopY family transcriptional regulator [Thermoplasmata archaeon]|nr:BlaI/MecI/CopY family transcriptional regulator [Thermoplasmata archaeon]